MGVRRTTVAVAVAVAFVVGMAGLAACGDDEPADAAVPVEILDVIDDVAYYPACSNEPVDVEGTTWYPVPEWGNEQLAELYAEITSVERARPVAVQGLAPRVAEPGPGDDVGTLVVYADDVARFESDSGLVQWLTTDVLTYDWVC